MVKLTRGQAERRVVASAERMSARLLAEETTCFKAIEDRFAAAIPTVTLKEVEAVRKNMPLRTRWVQAHRRAIVEARADVDRMAWACARIAAEAITDELHLINRTYPAQMQVVEPTFTDDELGRLATGAGDTWLTEVYPLANTYGTDQTDCLRRARDVVQLRKLLWSDTSSPCGVWWRTVSWAEAQARWVSVSVGNRVRLDGMQRFNDAEAAA